MPTVGWIDETGIDRFYERGLSGDDTHRPRRFACRECSKEFDSLYAREMHELEHPVANPVMTILGREVMGNNFKVTHKITPSDVSLAFVDQVLLNGEPLPNTETLGEILGETSKGFFDIALHRKGLSKRVKVDVLIAPEEQLKAVDQSFLRWFSRDDFTGGNIEQFAKDTAHCSEAIWYRDGLVRYLHGIMAKDQRSEVLGFEDFNQCFNQALQQLKDYPTPLSYSLRRLIKFSQNDFSDDGGETLVPALDNSLSFFTGKAPATSTFIGRRTEQVPADHLTSQILNDLVKHYGNYSLVTMEQVVRQQNAGYVPLEDHQKLLYLCYRKALDEGNKRAQRDYGRKLVYDDVFSVEVPDLEEL